MLGLGGLIGAIFKFNYMDTSVFKTLLMGYVNSNDTYFYLGHAFEVFSNKEGLKYNPEDALYSSKTDLNQGYWLIRDLNGFKYIYSDGKYAYIISELTSVDLSTFVDA